MNNKQRTVNKERGASGMKSVNATAQWARSEASRCLFCVDAPCMKGCPTEIDIPQFIRLLRWGDVKGAKEIIKAANCLGTLCGYLCPSEELCEKNCLRSKIDSPIRIAALQRFACDHGQYRLETLRPRGVKKRVAVIGAGPAGISCAVELRNLGYKVEIFEREGEIAGTVAREIPEFKLPRSLIDREMKELEIDKIKIHFGIEVDPKKLETEIEKYDAVFLGVGLSKAREARLKGETLKNVFDASVFLSRAKNGRVKKLKGVCVTIGGGDTALDCAKTALRLGATRSVVAYRRSQREMPAAEPEFLTSVREGVEFLWQVSPVRLIGEEKVAQVEFIRTELESSSAGRRRFKEIPGTKFKFPADAVILALGKERDDLLNSIPETGKKAINPETLQLGDTKYFAGGDVVNLGKTVVEAVAHGKKAAHSIDRYLRTI